MGGRYGRARIASKEAWPRALLAVEAGKPITSDLGKRESVTVWINEYVARGLYHQPRVRSNVMVDVQMSDRYSTPLISNSSPNHGTMLNLILDK